MTIAVVIFFVAMAIAILIYGVKSVYDLMDGVDDKQPNNQKSKDDEL